TSAHVRLPCPIKEEKPSMTWRSFLLSWDRTLFSTEKEAIYSSPDREPFPPLPNKYRVVRSIRPNVEVTMKRAWFPMAGSDTISPSAHRRASPRRLRLV